jgi:aerobic carbon-monoxide dehydrogenase medium subunit
MTLLRPFALDRPESLEEAGAVLAEHGSGAALYAGGTELLLLMKEGLIRVQRLVDVKRVAGLADIRAEGETLIIGATARHRAVEGAALLRERCRLVASVARHVANVRVRHVGTVGGNLAFADPHSDLATLFLALDAEVTLWSRAGDRRVALQDFVTGAYETVRRDDEILTGVRFRPWPAGTISAYVKFGVHERPTLGVAVAATRDADGLLSAMRLSVGCVGPRPQRFAEVERQAVGLRVPELAVRAPALAQAAADTAETASDLHGSAEYKRDMTRVFVRRAIETVAARAAGEEPRARYPYTVIV